MIRNVLCLLLAALSLSGPLCAQEHEIVEPVKIFDEYHATDEMEKAAEVTTSDFRDGKSKEQWVRMHRKPLQDLGYNRLSSEVKNYKVKDDQGILLLRAKIMTMVGFVVQEELYSMVLRDGKWLIDEMEIVKEEAGGPASDL